MNFPRKIHYFWTGNKISEKDLRNIIAIKSDNPGFEVNIWGRGNVKSLILNTLYPSSFKLQPARQREALYLPAVRGDITRILKLDWYRKNNL